MADQIFEKRIVLSPKDSQTVAYAVPKMVKGSDGTIYLFCHQRFESRADFGYPKDGLVIRSTDCGKTWMEPQRIAHVEGKACRPLGAIADIDSGKIFAFVKVMPIRNDVGDRVDASWFFAHEKEARELGYMWCVVSSDDGGESWSDLKDITDVLYRHSGPNAFAPQMTGIQLTHAPFKGRLVVPTRTFAKPIRAEEHFRNCVIYSDDHGETWICGGLSQSHVGESAIVELRDGRIYMNNRNHADSRGYRSFAISDDGGESFGNFGIDRGLPEPLCHASAVSDKSLGVVYFSNPASQERRHHMTVRASLDDCVTWPLGRLIDEGNTAYSSLAVCDDGSVLLAYETGESHPREALALARFNYAWLSEGGEPGEVGG